MHVGLRIDVLDKINDARTALGVIKRHGGLELGDDLLFIGVVARIKRDFVKDASVFERDDDAGLAVREAGIEAGRGV